MHNAYKLFSTMSIGLAITGFSPACATLRIQIYDSCGYQEKISMRVNYKTSENHVTILELKKLETFSTEYGRLKNLSVIKSVNTVEAAYSISS